jgi:membrane associated rhomboid family serine protease
MVMPLWDHSPFKWPTPPYVMWLLIVVNFIVFIVQVIGGPQQMHQVDRFAALIPAALTGQAVGGLWPPLTLITSQFLHIDFWHVFSNMTALFVFGDDIEEVLGHWRFLALYLLSGIGSDLVFVLSSPNGWTIGASGAVAGVLSAYLLFRPCARVICLLGLIPLRLKAYWIICGWAIWQVLEAANGVRDVAYWAHVGGLITGAVLFIVMRPAGVKLFDCVHSESVFAKGKFDPSGFMRFVMYIGTAITALAAIAALALFTMPVTQWRTCTGSLLGLDTQIKSCTALIQSSQERARDRAFAYSNRGLAWQAKGDNERAIADYSEAIRLDSKNVEYLNNRCWARAIAGRELPLAVTDCTEALRIAPNDSNIMDSRGFAYLRLSRLDDAVADYDEALRRNQKLASSLYGRGLAKLKKGDAGGEADIAAAKSIRADIAEEFARYGVTPIRATLVE